MEEKKNLLKINSKYGLAYFIISLWVIVAAITLIIVRTITGNLNLVYWVAAIGLAYCLTLLTCEIVRNRKKKEPAAEEAAAPAPISNSEVLYTLTSGLSKIVICDYLSSNYNFIESIHRPDYAKPGRGQTRGLLLADTHYIIDNKDRKCFMYVYENDQKEISILLKTTNEHYVKIKLDHPSAEVSNFPKVTKGNSYYKLVIDSTYTREQLFKIIDEALGFFAVSEEAVEEEKVSKISICKHLEAQGSKVISKNRPNYTQPGRGQTKGLPLADTHYLKNGKEKVCFMYVYEDDDKNVTVLLKTKPGHFEKIKANHKDVAISNFPKVSHGDIFYSIPVTKGFASSELYKIIDEAIENLSK